MYHELKSVIKEKYGQDACNVGDEGGFAPNIQSNLEGIELLMAAIKKAGYEDKVSLQGQTGAEVWERQKMERPRGGDTGSRCFSPSLPRLSPSLVENVLGGMAGEGGGSVAPSK